MSHKFLLGVFFFFGIIAFIIGFKKNPQSNSRIANNASREYNTLERSNGLKNTLKGIGTTIYSLGAVVVGLSSLMGFTIFGDFPTFKKNLPIQSIAAKEWEDELNCLRMKVSSAYIEKEIGSPIIQSASVYKGINIATSLYHNEYFTLLCYYSEDTLFGYLIISNNNHFTLSNYRCNFELINYSMKETMDYCMSKGVAPLTFYSCSTNRRLDCNRYFLQCGFQHGRGGGDNFYIGYGFTDIGMSISRDDFDCIFNNDTLIQIQIEKEKGEDLRLDWSSDKKIATFPINMFLVFDDSNNYRIDVRDFICSQVARNGIRIGLNKDELANLQPDYMKAIENMGY